MASFPDYTKSGFFQLRNPNGNGNGNGNGCSADNATQQQFQTQAFPSGSLVVANASALASSSSSTASSITPTYSTVVIGKGSVPKKAPGNHKLRAIVRDRLKEYAAAPNKIAKSSIVTDVYYAIEQSCRNEGSTVPFLRYGKNGYACISETVGREKISSAFRDCLCDRYRSSSKNKVARRRAENQKKVEERRRCQSLFPSSHNSDPSPQPCRRQQQERPNPVVPILPFSHDDSLQRAIGCLQQRQREEKQQRQQQIEQQQQEHNDKRQNSFTELCSKLFAPSSSSNNNRNLSASEPITPTPFFEFARSFLRDCEPEPIPELDCSSACSSSSCSFQDSDGYCRVHLCRHQ